MQIEAKNISVIYEGRYFLKQHSYFLKEKQSIFLQGANGAGKTTLIKILSGFLKADEGEVFYSKKQQKISITQAKHDIALCLSDSFLCPEMTLEENYFLFDAKFKLNEKNMDLLQRFSMLNKLSLQVKYFSKGEMQKAALCRAFLKDPSVYFLDEPFVGLDVNAQQVLVNYLNQEKKNKTLLISSHQGPLKNNFYDDVWNL